ncbi:MAG: HEAT repeat domain-containing protein [Acidobacteria bacterium]|nr:HEAT repeat domain-containing protein [Acidobacteriota bacterium]
MRSLILFPLTLLAQPPSVGVLDFYGLRQVAQSDIRAALPFKEGDPLPPSKGDVEEALEQVKGVVRARLEAVCCQEGKAILYVGIEERGAPHFEYNAPPTGIITVPEDVQTAYAEFLTAVNRAARTGSTSENLSSGHSLLSDPGAREKQLNFIPLADKHLPLLRRVLKESSDAGHRAIAAYVMGYTRNKRQAAVDLQLALRDPDDTVRNNAMRALGAIAVFAALQPPDVHMDDKIEVPATWFIETLDSLIWTDRAVALNVLVTLTERRDAKLMAHLKERSLPAIAEMARWKHLPHALPAFILLGRIHGESEPAIQSAWSGSRDAFLKRLAAPPKRR